MVDLKGEVAGWLELCSPTACLLKFETLRFVVALALCGTLLMPGPLPFPPPFKTHIIKEDQKNIRASRTQNTLMWVSVTFGFFCFLRLRQPSSVFVVEDSVHCWRAVIICGCTRMHTRTCRGGCPKATLQLHHQAASWQWGFCGAVLVFFATGMSFFQYAANRNWADHVRYGAKSSSFYWNSCNTENREDVGGPDQLQIVSDALNILFINRFDHKIMWCHEYKLPNLPKSSKSCFFLHILDDVVVVAVMCLSLAHKSFCPGLGLDFYHMGLECQTSTVKFYKCDNGFLLVPRSAATVSVSARFTEVILYYRAFFGAHNSV